MMARKSFALLAFVLAAVPLAAQAPRAPYSRDWITWFQPAGIPWEVQHYRLDSVRTAVIEDDGNGGLKFNGSAWPAGDLGRARRCRVSGPIAEPKLSRMRFMIDCPNDWYHHFFIATTNLTAAQQLIDRVIAPGEADGPAARAIRERVVARVASALFADDLASVPEEKRLAILKTAGDAGATGVKKTTYREASYLELDLGTHADVFNTIQLNRTQRVARVVLEQLIPAARKIEESLAGVEPIAGIALTLAVSFKNFVTPNNNEAGVDNVEMFLPRAELRKLLNDEITSQQLVTAAVVRVNGNRVDVDLTQQ
jgi:hypothetical protein